MPRCTYTKDSPLEATRPVLHHVPIVLHCISIRDCKSQVVLIAACKTSKHRHCMIPETDHVCSQTGTPTKTRLLAQATTFCIVLKAFTVTQPTTRKPVRESGYELGSRCSPSSLAGMYLGIAKPSSSMTAGNTACTERMSLSLMMSTLYGSSIVAVPVVCLKLRD